MDKNGERTRRSLDCWKMVMVNFYEKCIDALNKAIVSYRLSPIDFEEVQGKYEEYRYAKVVKNDFKIEIYIYKDEAGCEVNNDIWTIFERWDFSNDIELIQRFVDYIVKLLISGPDIKDDQKAWFGQSIEEKKI
jgi:hypothetical protein